MFKNIEPIKILKNHLKDEIRINHCISTADFMRNHAKQFNIDQDHAYISGLLHDLAKEMPVEKILKLSEIFFKRKIINIKYYKFKKKHPVLLHGVASAEILNEKYGIENKEILEAVCNHTCGGSNISDLSIFTFVSDFCEPLRSYTPSKIVYKIIVKEKNLYKACLYTYIYLIKRLVNKQKVIIPDSIDGYNFSLKLYNKF